MAEQGASGDGEMEGRPVWEAGALEVTGQANWGPGVASVGPGWVAWEVGEMEGGTWVEAATCI